MTVSGKLFFIYYLLFKLHIFAEFTLLQICPTWTYVLGTNAPGLSVYHLCASLLQTLTLYVHRFIPRIQGVKRP